MDVYGKLGVRTIVNAAGFFSHLGSCSLPVEVVEAMASAASRPVDLDELQVAAGEVLADLTRNEAAYVTSGCAAAIALATLACITGGDPARIARLPEGRGLDRTVVMHRAHRIPYDRAVELVGGRILEIGNAMYTLPWELEAALEDSPAAVLWVAGSWLPDTTLTLDETIVRAHASGVPVIVDAAAQLPPLHNLWHFTSELGADLALFSGGKALRGPLASGLMVGRRDLIEAARANGAPHAYLARALRVGKQEICGLIAAVHRFTELDHALLAKRYEEIVERWAFELQSVPGVTVRRAFPNHAGQPVPRLHLCLETGARLRRDELVRRCYEGDPRVAVLRGEGESVYLTPDTLSEDAEAEVVAARLREVLVGSVSSSC